MSTELTIARKLVSAALDAGYSVSVYDGEEWCLSNSRDLAEIVEALRSTDSDTLRFRDAKGERVGTVILIWGNGDDLISDHTDNDAINALVAKAA